MKAAEIHHNMRATARPFTASEHNAGTALHMKAAEIHHIHASYGKAITASEHHFNHLLRVSHIWRIASQAS